MKTLRIATLALTLLAPVGLAAAAQATVSPADEATDVISVVKEDKAGDVRVEKSARGKVTKRMIASTDVSRIDYTVDRVQQQLTVRYSLRHRPVSTKPYRLYYATVVMPDARDYAAPTTVLISRPGDRAVRTLSLTDDTLERCSGSAVTTAKGGRVVTQTVPFSCLGDELEHGQLWSGVGLERKGGGDLAWDTARRTRDLPLTPYVAPEE